MKHYCNPLNLEYRYQFLRKVTEGQDPGPFKGYREAADPSLILFKGTYFLFPSMTAGFFTSENLYEWEFHEYSSNIPVYDYAPDVRAVGDYMYFCASVMGKNGSFYRTKDPRTEEFQEIQGTFPFWDPCLFADDDEAVYFYWGSSNQTPIYGIQLDPHTLTPVCEKKELIYADDTHRGYERYGDDHIPPKSEEQIEAEVEAMLAGMKQQALAQGRGDDIGMSEEAAKEMLRGYMGNSPYMEGPWMTKHNGKYYLQYAFNGTEFNCYGDGVYVSDKPLGPFVPAKNNPYSYVPGGFLQGAGHGSTLEDKQGDMWHISTVRISNIHTMERRLGLWKAGFDEDGELYCDQRFADWPVRLDGKPFDKPDYMLLSYGCKTQVSSGNGAEHITDENVKTFWKAEGNQPGEWAVVDLGSAESVNAVQVNFADDGLADDLTDKTDIFKTFYEERWIDREKQPTRWLLEGSEDGEHYEMLVDKRKTDTDYAHDFVELEEAKILRYIRLSVESLPYGQNAAVSGIRVFGRGSGSVPGKAKNTSVDYAGKLDIDVNWEAENTTGAVVLWGYAPEKLYHSKMVYGDQKTRIGAIVEGQPVYVRVDTFNRRGVTEGETLKVKE